jgi:hypothetical protein
MANDKGDGEDLFEDLDKFFAPIRDVDWDEPEESTERAPQEAHVEVRSEEPAEATQELIQTEMPPGGSEEDAVGGEPDDAWYESGALEPIDAILGETPDDAGEPDVIVVDASAYGEGTSEPEGEVFEPAETSALEGEPSEEDLEAAAAHFSGSIGDTSYATEPVDALGGSEVRPRRPAGRFVRRCRSGPALGPPGPRSAREDRGRRRRGHQRSQLAGACGGGGRG